MTSDNSTSRDGSGPVLKSQSRNTRVINCIASYNSHLLTNCDRCDSKIHRRYTNLCSPEIFKHLRSGETEWKNLRARKVLQNLFETGIACDDLLRIIRLFHKFCLTSNNLVKRDDRCEHVRIAGICNSLEHITAGIVPWTLQDTKVISVEDVHRPYSSFRISDCRSSRPSRRISAKSGSSLNEPSILDIQPGFLAARSILLDCESLRRFTSFSNRSSLSSTVAMRISQVSQKTLHPIVPCDRSKRKGRIDAI